jgi:trigger factor
MQVSVEKTSSLGRRLTIEVPADQLKSEEKLRLQDFAKRAKIDGFRAGKVPADYIQKKYGPQIRQEAISQVLQSSLGTALQEQNLRPANRPNVEEVKDEQNLIYTVSFEVYPDINLADLSKIELEKLIPEITDADIDSGISKLQDQFASWEAVDRAAQNGDQITIDFVGTMDGVEFQGGTAQDFALELGSNRLIDGFESGLVGASNGSERVLDLQFPSDYKNTELAGKPVQFKVTVKKIEAKILAPVDGEFAANIGIEDKDVSKIRDKIKENMIKYVEELNQNKMRDQAIEQLYAVNKFDVPDSLVHKHEHDLLHQKYGNDAHSMELSADQKREMAEEAHKSIAMGLLLNELIQRHNLKPEKDRILAKLRAMAISYGGTPDMLQRIYQESKELRERVHNMAVSEQAADFVISGATIKERPAKFYDIVNEKT